MLKGHCPIQTTFDSDDSIFEDEFYDLPEVSQNIPLTVMMYKANSEKLELMGIKILTKN